MVQFRQKEQNGKVSNLLYKEKLDSFYHSMTDFQMNDDSNAGLLTESNLVESIGQYVVKDNMETSGWLIKAVQTKKGVEYASYKECRKGCSDRELNDTVE